MENEEMTIVRFLIPKSWKKRANRLGLGYGTLSELGRPAFLKALEEAETKADEQSQQQAKAS